MPLYHKEAICKANSQYSESQNVSTADEFCITSCCVCKCSISVYIRTTSLTKTVRDRQYIVTSHLRHKKINLHNTE